jgi:NADPH-dependent curcumin reductase CurA
MFIINFRGKKGSLVLSKAGWASHHVSTGEGLEWISFDLGSTPRSYTLGTLGMPGYLTLAF